MNTSILNKMERVKFEFRRVDMQYTPRLRAIMFIDRGATKETAGLKLKKQNLFLTFYLFMFFE